MKSVKNAFKKLYAPITYMKKRYPDAAKKRRILTKWINRFGDDVNLRDYMGFIPKATIEGGVLGADYICPVVFGEEK